MGQGSEAAIANKPEAQAPPEEEEEEEPVDPQSTLKEECIQSAQCQKYFEKLVACNEKVSARSSTEETCEDEMIDFVHSVDHCVAKSLFSKLK